MKSIFPNYAEMRSNIKTLDVNGLRGRMLVIKSRKSPKREILMLYGHHASLERVYGLADELSHYGNITVPDFPGFGGMDSFYKIGIHPSIDTMADYLATFIKLRYKNKKFTLIGMSLGFVIATRMLQKYPELANKVVMLISMVGFTRYDDVKFSKNVVRLYKLLGHTFRHRIPALFFYNVVLHPSLIRLAYAKTPNAKKKFEHLSRDDFRRAMDFEVTLWRDNEVRTYMEMTLQMLNLDNCKKQINLPVHHVAVDSDQYFDNNIVEQHMRVIFTDYIEHKAILPNHAPSIVASKEEAAPFIPKSLRKVLS